MANSSAKKKKEMRDYARNAVKQMLLWAQQEYKLDEKFLDATIIISFAENRQCSYGGWHKNRQGKWRPYINLRLNSCTDFAPQMQMEYEWYRNDPEIGKKWAATWKAWIRVEAAHECSHVLEIGQPYVNATQKTKLVKKFGRSKPSDDHTAVFQKIYRVFRRKFVNGIRSKKTTL